LGLCCVAGVIFSRGLDTYKGGKCKVRWMKVRWFSEGTGWGR
jgi:hypothetical protein